MECWNKFLWDSFFFSVWIFSSGGSLTKLLQRPLSGWSKYWPAMLRFGAKALGQCPTGAQAGAAWRGGLSVLQSQYLPSPRWRSQGLGLPTSRAWLGGGPGRACGCPGGAAPLCAMHAERWLIFWDHTPISGNL